MKIQILYGSESGCAELLAEDFEIELKNNFDCDVSDLDSVDPKSLTSDGLCLVICSTTGSGDVPGNAEGFYAALQNTKPDLSHVTFAIFGIGDRTYSATFNQGSEKIMQAMLDCGAKLVGERYLYDSAGSDMPEDVAFPWFHSLPIAVTA